MADNTELFEYLFAVRISLQDSYENESDIIRELKMTLREMRVNSNQANKTLHEFYQAYGIDISIDTIKEASTNTNQLLNNMLGFMLSSGDFAHSGHPDDNFNNDEENHDNDDEELVDEANNIENEDQEVPDGPDGPDDENFINQSSNINNFEQLFHQAFVQALGLPVQPQESIHPDVPEIDDFEPADSEPASVHPSQSQNSNANVTISFNGNTFTFNSQNPQLINLLNNSGSNFINPPIIPNISGSVGPHASMFNVLNTLLGANHSNGFHGNAIPVPVSQNMFSDVVVSIDDKDLDSLKTIKLETKLDTDCSICMGHLEKDDEASELKCSHTFHSDCIKQYLSQYNYKCPVCRSEVGKAKYNI